LVFADWRGSAKECPRCVDDRQPSVTIRCASFVVSFPVMRSVGFPPFSQGECFTMPPRRRRTVAHLRTSIERKGRTMSATLANVAHFAAAASRQQTDPRVPQRKKGHTPMRLNRNPVATRGVCVVLLSYFSSLHGGSWGFFFLSSLAVVHVRLLEFNRRDGSALENMFITLCRSPNPRRCAFPPTPSPWP